MATRSSISGSCDRKKSGRPQKAAPYKFRLPKLSGDPHTPHGNGSPHQPSCQEVNKRPNFHSLLDKTNSVLRLRSQGHIRRTLGPKRVEVETFVDATFHTDSVALATSGERPRKIMSEVRCGAESITRSELAGEIVTSAYASRLFRFPRQMFLLTNDDEISRSSREGNWQF